MAGKNAEGRSPAAEEPSEELPRRFERLTLLRHLARGGMGEVFLATSGGIEGAERPCVVKIIRREHINDRSFLARFFDEARIQSQLEHPGVVQVLEAAVDASGKPYVVVEYVEGRNLGEVRTRAAQLGVRVGWPDVVALGVTLGDALAHVHQRTDPAGKPLEIAHRDLSPQNVMVGYSGDVKVIDFGTARGENRRCHTVAGIVFAKPGYVAPEVASNTPGGAPADIYAFGIMLWELLAGRRFLAGESAEHMAAVAAGKRVPSPIAESVEAPRELDALIARLTAVSPEQRPSAREATLELARLLKLAPSLADGERSVRARIAHLMQRLYPAEPARTRAEFARLVNGARKLQSLPLRSAPALPPPSPAPEPEPDPELLPGTRYRLGRELGRGAMAVVHEALQVDLGRTVAIKVLQAGAEGSADLAERFRSEVRAIAAIEHENLVRLYDYGIARDARPFYAMELLEGESLDRFLSREKGMDWREATKIGIQACRALEAAHNAGVVNRDIKPANLFLTKSGTLKLLDFGVAKHATEIERPNGDDAPAGAIVVIGTPEYMAPEQISGGAADQRSDLYALGSVLYELVTGMLPYVASSTVALLDSKLRTRPEPPRERAPQRGLPKMVDSIIVRALEPKPEQRFQNASEMREALEAALREPEIAQRRRRRIALSAAFALMLALGGGAAFGVSRIDLRASAAAITQPMLERARAMHAGAATETAAAAQPPSKAAQAEPPTTGESQPSAAKAATAPSGENDDTDEVSESAEKEPGSAEKTGDQSSDDGAGKSGDESAKNDDNSDQDDDQAAKDDAKPSAAEPRADKKSGGDIETRIAAAQELMKNGARLKGFDQIRRIGKNNRKDVRALKAWAEAAMDMKGWGEAYRVAQQWVKRESSEEACLTFARMARAIGKRDEAVITLTKLIEEHPGNEEARAMLTTYQGTRVAMHAAAHQ